MMAALYDVDVRTISEHIQNIFKDRELTENSTIRNFRTVQNEGGRQVERNTKHYNLQIIIAVGFKVNNDRAVEFRKWANRIVKDYTIQGWVMDAERLKHGHMFTDEYFGRPRSKNIDFSPNLCYNRKIWHSKISEISQLLLTSTTVKLPSLTDF